MAAASASLMCLPAGSLSLHLLLLQVLSVYCYDPRFFALSPWGLSKTGPHRAAFLQECVADLQASLQQLGSGLLVAVGRPEAVIASALEGCAEGANLVLTQQEVTSEETGVDAAVRRAIKGKAQLTPLWGPSLYHFDDLPYAQGLGDMPSVFTPFREKVEKQCKVRGCHAQQRASGVTTPSSLLSSAGAQHKGVAYAEQIHMCQPCHQMVVRSAAALLTLTCASSAVPGSP
jgi:deoxyribodipyrimidine photolyase